MASVTTSEFVKASTEVPPFSLIEQKSLLSRLAEEVWRASIEFVRDPRGFVRDLVTDDTRDLKRRRQMRLLLAGAVAFHLALLAVIILAGWRAISKNDKPDLVLLGMVEPTSPARESKEQPVSAKPNQAATKRAGATPAAEAKRIRDPSTRACRHSNAPPRCSRNSPRLKRHPDWPSLR
jgi:hypothetical protein